MCTIFDGMKSIGEHFTQKETCILLQAESSCIDNHTQSFQILLMFLIDVVQKHKHLPLFQHFMETDQGKQITHSYCIQLSFSFRKRWIWQVSRKHFDHNSIKNFGTIMKSILKISSWTTAFLTTFDVGEWQSFGKSKMFKNLLHWVQFCEDISWEIS